MYLKAIVKENYELAPYIKATGKKGNKLIKTEALEASETNLEGEVELLGDEDYETEFEAFKELIDDIPYDIETGLDFESAEFEDEDGKITFKFTEDEDGEREVNKTITEYKKDIEEHKIEYDEEEVFRDDLMTASQEDQKDENDDIDDFSDTENDFEKPIQDKNNEDNNDINNFDDFDDFDDFDNAREIKNSVVDKKPFSNDLSDIFGSNFFAHNTKADEESDKENDTKDIDLFDDLYDDSSSLNSKDENNGSENETEDENAQKDIYEDIKKEQKKEEHKKESFLSKLNKMFKGKEKDNVYEETKETKEDKFPSYQLVTFLSIPSKLKSREEIEQELNIKYLIESQPLDKFKIEQELEKENLERRITKERNDFNDFYGYIDDDPLTGPVSQKDIDNDEKHHEKPHKVVEELER